MRLSFCWLVLGASVGARWAPLCAQATTAAVPPRNVAVRVVTDPEGAPLGYSVVSLPELGVERLTGSSGAIVVSVSIKGPVRLRVKRLGFTPKDTSITVTDALSQTVVVALPRVSFTLDAVHVVAWPPCKRPGLPRRGGDAQVRGIIEQLRQNAERYRLLTRSYPFTYSSAREFSRRSAEGTEAVERTDTIAVSGVPSWTYRPGFLVSRDAAPKAGDSGWIMHIPVLSDLAEDPFVDAHCFHVAGLEDKEGEQLLRLDILAAERLRGADVNVVVWLDPTNFQLRHATFMLSRIPASFRGLVAVTSRVTYGELLPFVPVMELTVTENVLRDLRGSAKVVVVTERQRIVQLTFLGPIPDGIRTDSLPPAPTGK